VVTIQQEFQGCDRFDGTAEGACKIFQLWSVGWPL